MVKGPHYRKSITGVPGWLSQLSIRLAQVMISLLMSLSPTLGTVLTAESLEPASDAVSPSLSAPHPHRALSLSPSKINTKKKRKEKKRKEKKRKSITT